MFHTPFSLPDLFQDIRQELAPVPTPLPADRRVVRRPTPSEEDDMTWITTAAEQVSFLMHDDAPVFVPSHEQSDALSDDIIVIDDSDSDDDTIVIDVTDSDDESDDESVDGSDESVTDGIFGKIFAKISAFFAYK